MVNDYFWFNSGYSATKKCYLPRELFQKNMLLLLQAFSYPGIIDLIHCLVTGGKLMSKVE